MTPTLHNQQYVGTCTSIMKYKVNADDYWIGCEHQDIYHAAIATKHFGTIRLISGDVRETWTTADMVAAVRELREQQAGEAAVEASLNAGHEVQK